MIYRYFNNNFKIKWRSVLIPIDLYYDTNCIHIDKHKNEKSSLILSIYNIDFLDQFISLISYLEESYDTYGIKKIKLGDYELSLVSRSSKNEESKNEEFILELAKIFKNYDEKDFSLEIKIEFEDGLWMEEFSSISIYFE